ncbi:MAG: hypothetical protein V8R46_04065 [Eubacterium ramulus]
MALCGFACSMAASGGTFSAVVYIYERFENLQIFQVLQPVYAPDRGRIASESLHFHDLSEHEYCLLVSLPLISMVLLTFGIFLLNVFWRRRGVVRPLQMVLFSAVASLIVCNVFASIP